MNDEFYVDFYRNKGCEFIVRKLKTFLSEEGKSVYSLDTLIKTIVMPNMLKILNSYLFCLYSENKLYLYLRKAKINHIELDLMTSQLGKIDEVVGAGN